MADNEITSPTTISPSSSAEPQMPELAYNDAGRVITNVIEQRINMLTGSAAGVDVTWGTVASIDSPYECSVYLWGDTDLASEGFRIENGVVPNVLDPVRVSIDQRGNRWIDAIQQDSDAVDNKLEMNARAGTIVFGRGSEAPPLLVRQSPDTSGARLQVTPVTGTATAIVDVQSSSGTRGLTVRTGSIDTTSPFFTGLNSSGSPSLEFGPGGATARDVLFTRTGAGVASITGALNISGYAISKVYGTSVTRLNSTQSIATSTWTTVTTDGRDWGDATLFPVSSGNVTLPVNGVYAFALAASTSVSGAARRVIGLSINGANPDMTSRLETTVSATAVSQAISWTGVLYLTAGTTVGCALFQSTGNAGTIDAMRMSIVLLGNS